MRTGLRGRWSSECGSRSKVGAGELRIECNQALQSWLGGRNFAWAGPGPDPVFAEARPKRPHLDADVLRQERKVFIFSRVFLQEPIIGLDFACEYAKLPESVQGTSLPEWSLTELGLFNHQKLGQNFQEEIPLKLKSLAVIALLVLGCGAAFGQSYSFGFLSYTGGIQYCDYEVLSVSAPYAAGTHDLKTVCGFPLDGVMVGLKTDIPTNIGAPVSGGVYALADSTFDAQYIGVSGCQMDWVTKLVAPKVHLSNPHYGWSFYFTCGGGGDYLGNYGFLTTTLGAPSQGGPVKSSAGKTIEKAMSK